MFSDFVFSGEMSGGRLALGGWFSKYFYVQLLLCISVLIFLVFKTYHLAGLMVPLWHHWEHFGTLCVPCGTVGATGRTRGVRKQIFSSFEMIPGPHFGRFVRSDVCNSFFCLGLFPGNFLREFSNLNLDMRSS